MKFGHLLTAMILLLSACTPALPPPAPTAAPAPPLPAVSLLRQSLGPTQEAPTGGALYMYLLVGSHLADKNKVLAAFNAYLCEIPPNIAASRAAAGSAGRKVGYYLVPVTNPAPLGSGDSQKLLDDYDYARADAMLRQLVQSGAMRRSDLIPTGIYLAGFNAPLPQHPTSHAIFEISRLPNGQDVRSWLVAEQQAIELDGLQPSVDVRRVPPTLVEILDGLGATVATFMRITVAANAAETIPCR